MDELRDLVLRGQYLKAKKWLDNNIDLYLNSHAEELFKIILELSKRNKRAIEEKQIRKIFTNLDLENIKILLDFWNTHHLNSWKILKSIQTIKYKFNQGYISDCQEEIINYLDLIYIKRKMVDFDIKKIVNSNFKNNKEIRLKMLMIECHFANQKSQIELVNEFVNDMTKICSKKEMKEIFNDLSDIFYMGEKNYRSITHNVIKEITSNKITKTTIKRFTDYLVISSNPYMNLYLAEQLVNGGYLEEAQNIKKYTVKKYPEIRTDISRYFPILNPRIKKELVKVSEEIEKNTSVSLEKNSDPEDLIHTPLARQDDIPNEYLNVLLKNGINFNYGLHLLREFISGGFYEDSHRLINSIEMALLDKVQWSKLFFLKIELCLREEKLREALDLIYANSDKFNDHDNICALMYIQGQIYLRLGEADHAKRIFKKVLTINPNYRRIKDL